MIGIPFCFSPLFNRNSVQTQLLFIFQVLGLRVFIPIRIIIWLWHKIVKNILCNNQENYDILTEKSRNQENTYTEISNNNTPGKWINFIYVSRQWF